MMTVKLDKTKVKAVVLYILEEMGEADFHKIFKILYFADRYHLAHYGRAITNDNYVAMEHGPVPSFVYDVFKAVRGDGYYCEDLRFFYDALNVEGRNVKSLANPEMDNLSVSDVECLNKSIDENRNRDFSSLSRISHDAAWKKASKDGTMKIVDIAEAGGANDEMIKYVEEYIECNNIALS